MTVSGLRFVRVLAQGGISCMLPRVGAARTDVVARLPGPHNDADRIRSRGRTVSPTSVATILAAVSPIFPTSRISFQAISNEWVANEIAGHPTVSSLPSLASSSCTMTKRPRHPRVY